MTQPPVSSRYSKKREDMCLTWFYPLYNHLLHNFCIPKKKKIIFGITRINVCYEQR